jgi:hypothetical protein
MRNFLVLLGVLVLCVACLAQSPSNVQVNLSLSDEKAVYKIGEPIPLRLTFGASVQPSLRHLLPQLQTQYTTTDLFLQGESSSPARSYAIERHWEVTRVKHQRILMLTDGELASRYDLRDHAENPLSRGQRFHTRRSIQTAGSRELPFRSGTIENLVVLEIGPHASGLIF